MDISATDTKTTLLGHTATGLEVSIVHNFASGRKMPWNVLLKKIRSWGQT